MNETGHSGMDTGPASPRMIDHVVTGKNAWLRNAGQPRYPG